jgi:hypothetical protein
MPVYDLSITDEAGKSIPMGSRCWLSGLYSGVKWPDDYRFQILPGDAYEMSVDIARQIPESGRYFVTFRYLYDPESKDVRPRDDIKYPTDLWVGSAVSESTAIDLPKKP